MKPKINYHYTIRFKDITNFLFIPYGVDETCYKYRILPYLEFVIDELKKKPNNRQSVISTHTTFKNYACLISLQFQIVKNKLIVTANFRSQCKTNGRPADTVMLQYIANKVRRELKLKKYKIYVNVANYHDNTKLTEQNKNNEEVQRNLFLLKLYK